MDIYKEIIEQGTWLIVPQSSNIERIRYLKEDKTLIVQFKKGTYYKYEGVPGTLAFEFAKSPSKGKFLYSRIRNAFKGILCDPEGTILAHFSEKK